MFELKEGSQGWEGTTDDTKSQIIEGLEKIGYVIRTKEFDDKKFTEEVESEVGKATFKAAVKMEKDILDYTGIEKESNEKYHDYFKRAMDLKKTELEDATKKIGEFETKETDGNKVAEEYKAKFETFKATATKTEAELKSEIEQLQKGQFQNKVDSHIESAMVKIKADLKKGANESEQSLIDDAIKFRESQFKESHEAVDLEGTIIYHDKEGKPVLDQKEGHHMTAEQILRPMFADMVDQKRVAGGAGSGKGDQGGGSGKVVNVPDTIKTQDQLMTHLVETEKMSQDSKEFADVWAEKVGGLAIKVKLCIFA